MRSAFRQLRPLPILYLTGGMHRSLSTHESVLGRSYLLMSQ